MIKRKKLIIVLLVLILSLILAGCIGGSSDGSNEPVLETLEPLDAWVLKAQFSDGNSVNIIDFPSRPLEEGKNTVKFTYQGVTYESEIDYTYSKQYKIYTTDEVLQWDITDKNETEVSAWKEFLTDFTSIGDKDYIHIGTANNGMEKTFTIPAGTQTILIYNNGNMDVDAFEFSNRNFSSIVSNQYTFGVGEYKNYYDKDGMYANFNNARIVFILEEALTADVNLTVKTAN